MIPRTLRALMLQPDQRSIQRHAVNERFRAIDRIDNPAIAAGTGALRKFFAQDRVVGKSRGEPLAQQQFRLAVGDRHGRGILLSLDRQIAAPKIVQRQPARLARPPDPVPSDG